MKFVLLFCLAVTLVMAAWLHWSVGLWWDWSLGMGFVFGLCFLGVLDWIFTGINIFLPMRDRFLAEWRYAWRMYSVQAMFASGAVQTAWESIPADLKSGLPSWLGLSVSLTLLVFGIVGRFVKQAPRAAASAQ